jgi:pyruvate/2-oxoacid:ferredoxin oxidoreductase beta subunit
MSDHYFEFHDGGFFRSGHVACGGCVEALAMRAIFNTVGQDAIGVVSPSCGAIIAGAFPNSSMKIPAIHTTLEAAAATASGIPGTVERTTSGSRPCHLRSNVMRIFFTSALITRAT